MKKYGGQLIHHCRDEYGVIEVVDYKKIMRSLHFGNETQQSGMYQYDPIALLHPYTQAMVSVTALQEPRRVLLLGVGGGSIVKFLIHHFRHINLDAVDLRRAVINIAQEYFYMPVHNRHLNIFVNDFKDFLVKAKQSNKVYDLILIDLFSASKSENIIIGLDGQLKLIKSLLATNGFILINVLASDISALSSLQELSALFAGTLYEIPVDGANTVVLASNSCLKLFPTDTEFQYFEEKYAISVRKYLLNMSICA
ncbi:MAG: hypothetical protein OEZ38_02145 [Gammaproteobacteria bacterium]|nr:hypothetical protein [Gammaproteobacteria bacterium]